MRSALLWCGCLVLGGVLALLAMPRAQPPAEVAVAPATTVEEIVRWPPGWSLEGVVRDLAQRPVAGARVFRLLDGDVVADEPTDESGRFRFTDVRGDDASLRAVLPAWPWWERDGMTEATVPRGAKEVVLAIDVGQELVVRIANPADYGMRHDGADLLVLREGREIRLHRIGAVAGEIRFVGLRAGDSCTFWMARSAQGPAGARHVYATGLRPGSEAGLRVERGRSITGRLDVPAGAAPVSLTGTLGGIRVEARVRPDLTFDLAGLPEGTTWSLEASARVRDSALPWRGRATARPGSEVVVPMEPRATRDDG